MSLPRAADVRKVLEEDYKKMVEEGILLSDAESFDELMKKCADLEKRANQV